MTDHTITPFTSGLGELRARVAEMGGLAEAAIDAAMAALTRRDVAGASEVVGQDKAIDAIEADIERRVTDFIVARTPSPDALREALAALKIAGLVERIGDYAKNIAKRVAVLEDMHGIEPLSILPAMARATAEMVHRALDAYVARDAAASIAVCQSDRVVDDFYNSLFRALLTHMMEKPQHISASAHLLFIAKNLERIGDHATNIAEMVYYAATGTQMEERGRGEDPLRPSLAAVA